jgi:type III pantothenate kinase
MILAIDIGNTSINFGIFDGNRLILRYSLPSSERTTPAKCWKRLQGFLTSDMHIDGAILCSVVPGRTETIEEFARDNLKVPCKIFGYGSDVGIVNRYSAPRQVGGDRLVNAVAVRELYSLPAMIVDLGTAITVDVVTGEAEYLGGVIAPGLGISAEALYKKTSLLPKVEIVIPRKVLGTSTSTSMQSGLTHGFAAMIQGIVDALKEELEMDTAVVVATGGYTRILEPLLEGIVTFIDENLTLKGLNLVYPII